MAVNLANIPGPVLGSDAHSVASLSAMLNALNQNFAAIQTEINSIESTVAVQATEFLQDTVPNEAATGDKWFKTDTPAPQDATVINAYVCIQGYTTGDGLTTPQKEARFKLARDADTINQVSVLSAIVDGKTTTYQSDDPPGSMETGDQWINTTAGERDQIYTAQFDYDYTSNSPNQSPTGAPWSAGELASHFRQSGDKSAYDQAIAANTSVGLQRTNYLRVLMPGLNGGQDTGLSFKVGDSWTEDIAPDFQSYVCYLAYDTVDVPADPLLHPQFLLDHWREKGDKSGRAAAQAAQATADNKIENFRQETVPQDASILDTWFKDHPTLPDQDELYVCEASYTTAYINANYVTEGYATPDLFRESFWRQVKDQNALASAQAAADLANTKTTDYYLNDPPDAAIVGDKWIDKDATPVLTYVAKTPYDFSGDSPVWSATGSDPGPTTPSIPVYWDLTDDVSTSNTAELAKAYADGNRSTFTGLTPPENSGVADATYGSGFRPIEVGDTWIKVTNDPSAPAVDPVTGIAYYTTWVCYRSYEDVSGIGFTGTGYSTATGNDGTGAAVPPGDPQFTTANAYNYWKMTNDQTALEFAIDIQALQDGKRNTYISNSTVAAQQYGHSEGIPDASTAQGGISIGDIWVDEGSVASVNGATDTFQVYKCKRAYAYDAADPGDKFLSIIDNWLPVDEPVLRAQAMFRYSLIDGKRKIFVHGAVPNAGGPSNWDLITGAQIGDIWFDTASSPVKKYYCSTAYVTGGTLGNWTSLDQVGTPTGSNDVANKAYVDNAIANLVASAPGALDTLNELADALGDDPNFATTMTNALAGKLALAGGTMTGDVIYDDCHIELDQTTSGGTKIKFKVGGTLKFEIAHDSTMDRIVINDGAANPLFTFDNDGSFQSIGLAQFSNSGSDYMNLISSDSSYALGIPNKFVLTNKTIANYTGAPSGAVLVTKEYVDASVSSWWAHNLYSGGVAGSPSSTAHTAIDTVTLNMTGDYWITVVAQVFVKKNGTSDLTFDVSDGGGGTRIAGIAYTGFKHFTGGSGEPFDTIVTVVGVGRMTSLSSGSTGLGLRCTGNTADMFMIGGSWILQKG